MKKNKGFTLIELLVVIAIIGILSSVVLASLNSAREKSRDAKRVSDIKQLQLALELYFDSNSQYPVAITDLSPTFIPSDPLDPIDDVVYRYAGYTGAVDAGDTNICTGTEVCTAYHLGASLENATSATEADSDITGGTVDGPDADGCNNEAGRVCYDVAP